MAQENNTEPSQISLCLKTNKLSPNIKRTRFIFIYGKHMAGVIRIQIDNGEVDRVYKPRFLGVIINKKITLKEHITYLSGKMCRSIEILIKARHCLNKHAMITLDY